MQSLHSKPVSQLVRFNQNKTPSLGQAVTCPQPRKERERDLFCAHGYTISALESISSKERDKLEALLPSQDGESSDVVLPEACHEQGWDCLCGHLLLTCRTSLDFVGAARDHLGSSSGQTQAHQSMSMCQRSVAETNHIEHYFSVSSVLWGHPWEFGARAKAVGPVGVREPLSETECKYWCLKLCTQLCKLWPEHFN